MANYIEAEINNRLVEVDSRHVSNAWYNVQCSYGYVATYHFILITYYMYNVVVVVVVV